MSSKTIYLYIKITLKSLLFNTLQSSFPILFFISIIKLGRKILINMIYIYNSFLLLFSLYRNSEMGKITGYRLYYGVDTRLPYYSSSSSISIIFPSSYDPIHSVSSFPTVHTYSKPSSSPG